LMKYQSEAVMLDREEARVGSKKGPGGYWESMFSGGRGRVGWAGWTDGARLRVTRKKTVEAEEKKPKDARGGI